MGPYIFRSGPYIFRWWPYIFSRWPYIFRQDRIFSAQDRIFSARTVYFAKTVYFQGPYILLFRTVYFTTQSNLWIIQVNFSVAEKPPFCRRPWVIALGGNVNSFLSIHLKFASGVPFKFLKITGFSAYKLKLKFLIHFAIYFWKMVQNSPLDLYSLLCTAKLNQVAMIKSQCDGYNLFRDRKHFI